MIVDWKSIAITKTRTPRPISRPPPTADDPITSTPNAIAMIAGSIATKKVITPIALEPTTPSPQRSLTT